MSHLPAVIRLLLFLLPVLCIYSETHWPADKLFTLDGVVLNPSFHTIESGNEQAQQPVQNTSLYLLPGIESRDLREQLARQFKHKYHVIVYPSRRDRGARFLGANYHRMKNRFQSGGRYRYVSLIDTVEKSYDFEPLYKNRDRVQPAVFFLTAHTARLIEQNPLFVPEFERIVFLSPSLKMKDSDFWQKHLKNVRVLWLGTKRIHTVLELLQQKYGGEIASYERAASGYRMFFRNFKIKDDVTAWVDKK